MRTVVIEDEPQTQDEYPNRYAPIPVNGEKCQFTGLGHAKLYQLLGGELRARVRVVNLRSPKAKRGKTLFHVGDMLRYLNEQASTQAPR